ncbi:hypothetical protein DAEQUDRAFT_445438 [Daedalea quercina L-15889]|uniref:Ubiquitin-like protease family profile domain-containing protein n=1 Tax=Daedalea quercina L-15889 TaxID=1314783 RepID=A0A165N7S6_9APHY|nr:hypothetical protein DAEQUDRAFT_445438 [Daedalea quercina L-15889]
MDSDGAARLDNKVRCIRNIQITKQDLEPLLESKSLPVPGTTINAYGAILQDRSGFPTQDYCIFSSWLPMLVFSANTTAQSHEESFDDHMGIIGGPPAIQRRPRWAIPLCGGEPAHWVLGWVDFSAHQYGIFDSIPELRSLAWAETLLLRTCNAILRYASMALPEWKSDGWRCTTIAPQLQEQQRDAWSCGIFVLLAMHQFVDLQSEMYCHGNSVLPGVKKGVLKLLTELPIYVPRKRRALHPDSHDEDTTHDGIGDITSLGKRPHVAEAESSPESSLRGQPMAAKRSKHVIVVTEAEDSHSEYDTGDETKGNSSHSAATASKPRASKLSVTQRRERLEAEEWTLSVEPHRVKCRACMNWYTLHVEEGGWPLCIG